MDASLDKLSVDFDEELYPHKLTVIAGHRWVIGHGLRLAVMKCSESPELRQAFADVVSPGLVKGISEGLKHGPPRPEGFEVPVGGSAGGIEGCPYGVNHGIFILRESDGITVSVPTIAPQGLAILLADAATQTEVADEEDEPHPRLQRSISLPPFYNLEWK
ncbi:hypothetical protein Tco_1568570 [Tanacetum coccineum]